MNVFVKHRHRTYSRQNMWCSAVIAVAVKR